MIQDVSINILIFKHSPVHKKLQITFIRYCGFGFTNLCLYSYENICVTLSNTNNLLHHKNTGESWHHMFDINIKLFNSAYKTDFSRSISVWHHICLDLKVSVVFTFSSVQSQALLSTIFTINPLMFCSKY